MIEYERTYYLLHPTQYLPGWMTPALRAERRWTIGQSPHDAFLDAHGLLRRRVIAVNAFMWGNAPTLGVWAVANFPPGFELIDVVASSPDTLNQAVDRALNETIQPIETIQVYPLRYPMTQHNVSATRQYRELIESGRPIVVQRMNTSLPEEDARWGWPL